MAEPTPVGRQPGWREVGLVAAGVVAVVFGAAIITSFLPTAVQEVVFYTPLAILSWWWGRMAPVGDSRRRPDDTA